MPDDKSVNRVDDDDLYLDDDFDDVDNDDNGKEPDANYKQLMEELAKQKEINAKMANQVNELTNKLAPRKPQDQDDQEEGVQLPPRPSDYDVKAAYTEPTSESFRWRVEAEQIYKEYEEKQRFEAMRNMVRQELGMRDKTHAIDRQAEELKKSRNYSDEYIEGLNKWLSETKDGLTLKELDSIYRERTGLVKDSTKRDRGFMPGIDSFPGYYEPTDEDKAFEKGLLGTVKSRSKRY